MQQLPSYDPCDPGFRRLHYVRYADDFLLGFIGPKKEAEEIKEQIKNYLQSKLQLTLSDTKTLITHARTETARFLGYEITILHNNRKHGKKGQRNINGIIGLRIPKEVIRDKCKPYKKNGKSIHRAERLNDSPYSIVVQYQSEYRGIVEYYRRALNLYQIDHLRWIMECSLAKTLAHKHKISVTKVFNKYKTTVQTSEGPRKVLQIKIEREGKKPLIAQWGGISLKRRTDTILEDNPTIIWNKRTELVERLLADTCELCGSQENIEVHHIRSLKDLKQKGRKTKPEWMQAMIARNRKTLVVCKKCHVSIHNGKPIAE